MCTWATAGQMALQAFGIYQNSKANARIAEAQAKEAYKEMNYSLQNYEIQRQDAYDSAVNDIMKTRINQAQLNSQVNAAIAEGMAGGGRTANRLKRAAEADTSRAVSSIQDNYLRQSNEIDLNKETTLLSTKDYIKNLKAQSKPNKWADILNLTTTALQGYNDYANTKATRAASGVSSQTGSLNLAKKSYVTVGNTYKMTQLKSTYVSPYRLKGIG